MKKYFTTSIGRLRLYALLEGISLLFLICIAVPLKYFFDMPVWVQAIGPVHGGLFTLFVFNAVHTGIEQNWNFRTTTWKIILASLLPFGTFYIDRTILRRLHHDPQ